MLSDDSANPIHSFHHPFLEIVDSLIVNPVFLGIALKLRRHLSGTIPTIPHCTAPGCET